jgi:pimeloyl-ACP methyl ester carboxylesterase
MIPRVLFLPGAGGAAAFWHPVGARLPAACEPVYLSWPGLGDEPPDPRVRGFDDLVALVEAELTEPCDVVAQSMGGIVAVRLALRHPDKVRGLVLVATSGGVDVGRFGAADWRDEYRREFPRASAWVMAERPDHTNEIGRIAAPALLLWGDSDPISPVAVGEHLASLLPNATLRVIPGGTHGMAAERPDDVAPLIAAHLGLVSKVPPEA